MGLDEGGEEVREHVATCQENRTCDKRDENEDIRKSLSQGKDRILFWTRRPHLQYFHFDGTLAWRLATFCAAAESFRYCSISHFSQMLNHSRFHRDR